MGHRRKETPGRTNHGNIVLYEGNPHPLPLARLFLPGRKETTERRHPLRHQDLTESLTVSFKYVNGDDEAYAEKVAEEKKRRDKEAIGLFVKTGQDVINVFFKLASEEVTESIVKVEAVIQMAHNLYQNFPVEENRLKSAVTFASYKDLAYGNYLITVKQLSKDGKTVAETSITTKIEPEYHGPVRPVNIIN